jgi:hypothetical protein
VSTRYKNNDSNFQKGGPIISKVNCKSDNERFILLIYKIIIICHCYIISDKSEIDVLIYSYIEQYVFVPHEWSTVRVLPSPTLQWLMVDFIKRKTEICKREGSVYRFIISFFGF